MTERVPAHPLSPYRWVILAAATFAQMSFSAFTLGLPALAPAIRSDFDASLSETGALLGVVTIGLGVTLLPWGIASDRLGERLVMTIGLSGAAAALAASAFVHDLGAFAAFLTLAAALGACVNSAIGRAVLSWFAPNQRGLAYSIRQAGMMVAAAIAAATLPRVAANYGLGAAFLSLAVCCAVGSALSAAFLRPRHAEATPLETDGPKTSILDPRLVRLSVGSSFACVAQASVTAFVVLFLHDVRDVSITTAALCLAFGQLLGASVRIGTGVWSDRVGSRIGPLRKISIAVALAVGFAAAVQAGPLDLVFFAFVVAGGVSMGWNTVSFAAAVELGGATRGGATVGFQQSVLGLVAGVTPFAFVFLVGATSWTAAWWTVAAFPVVGWFVLRGLPLNEEYRRRRRRHPDPAV